MKAIAVAKQFLLKHLKITVTVVLATVLTVGTFFGWRYHQFRQSDVFAFTKLQSALTPPPNPADLALRVDFNTLSQHLSTAIATHYPFLKKGPDQLQTLKNMVQMALLKKLMTREEPPKEETDPLVRLHMPLNVLPEDFLIQFREKFAIQQPLGANSTLLSASVRHPVLGEVFPFVLRMDKTADGWMVKDIVNTDDLVRQFRAAEVKRMEARRDILLKKNEASLQHMDKTMPLQSCTAAAAMLSDGKSLILVAHILARNTSPVAVNITNISTTFLNESGEELLHKFLNASIHTQPGENFDNRWRIELDSQSELGQKIVSAGPITCTTRWQTMGLNNGEIFKTVEISELVEEFQ